MLAARQWGTKRLREKIMKRFDDLKCAEIDMKASMIILRLSLVFVFLSVGVGCSALDNEAHDDGPSQLPLVYSDGLGSCIDHEEVPDYVANETFESWVSGAHSVVFGTISEITPTYLPFRQTGVIPAEVSWDESECSGEIFPAFDITLTDVETLLGPHQEEVIFRVSRVHFQKWKSELEEDSNRAYRIVDRSAPDHGLAPGMKIGTRLYESELLPGILTPAMTWLFEMTDDDLLQFQIAEFEYSYSCPGDIGYYMRPTDDVRSGISFQTFRDELADVQEALANGSATSPEESDRPYIRSIWNLGDAQKTITLGTAYCEFGAE